MVLKPILASLAQLDGARIVAKEKTNSLYIEKMLLTKFKRQGID